MVKIWEARKEYTGRGFKQLFPTADYLRQSINPNPTTREEAMKNKDITEQMRKLGVLDVDSI